MVSCLGFCDQELVAVDDGFLGFFDLPFSDVAESFSTNGGLFGRLGDCPPLSPVVRELLEEGCLELCRLQQPGSVASSMTKL